MTKIEHHFSLLVHQFLINPPKIKIVFKDYLGENIEATTERITSNYYKITFLKTICQTQEQWRKVLVHEFTHLYLFSTQGNHTHDDNFYSHMEKFENWLDKNQNLTPRQNKTQDRHQHINWEKDLEIKLSEKSQLVQLVELIVKSSSLNNLEQSWKIVKNNLIYSNERNKTELDNYYSSKKEFFQLSERVESLKSNNINGWMWLTIISLVVIFFVLFIKVIEKEKWGKSHYGNFL